MAKTCPKIANSSNFWTDFCHFGYLIGPLVVISAHILVEEVISFKISGATSKMDKN